MAPRKDGLSYVVEGIALGKQYVQRGHLLKPHPTSKSRSKRIQIQLNQKLRRQQKEGEFSLRAQSISNIPSHNMNRVYHVPITLIPGPCNSFRPSHQLQPHDQHKVVKLTCPGNQRQWHSEHHLLDLWPIHLKCSCGGIWVRCRHRQDPARRLRKRQEKKAMEVRPFGNGSGGAPAFAGATG